MLVMMSAGGHRRSAAVADMFGSTLLGSCESQVTRMKTVIAASCFTMML